MEGWEKTGKGVEDKKRVSEHVCQSLSSSASAELTSLCLLMCDGEREKYCEYQISVEPRKGGQV